MWVSIMTTIRNFLGHEPSPSVKKIRRVSPACQRWQSSYLPSYSVVLALTGSGPGLLFLLLCA